MERKLLGRVGVDSGQLMIIDPCYISNQWVEEGNIIGIRFWGAGQDDAFALLKEQGYVMQLHQHAYQFISGNSDELSAFLKDLEIAVVNTPQKVIWRPLTTSTFDQICEITRREENGGSLPYLAGHEGLAVAFQPGFGDGLYDVYATYTEFDFGGMKDKRISKVEIILIDE